MGPPPQQKTRPHSDRGTGLKGFSGLQQAGSQAAHPMLAPADGGLTGRACEWGLGPIIGGPTPHPEPAKGAPLFAPLYDGRGSVGVNRVVHMNSEGSEVASSELMSSVPGRSARWLGGASPSTPEGGKSPSGGGESPQTGRSGPTTILNSLFGNTCTDIRIG